MSGMHRNRVKRRGHKKFISFQRIVQLFFAVFLNGYIIGFLKGRIFNGRSKAVCVPVLNCYSCPGALMSCPIGALQNAIGAKRQFPFYVFGLMMLFGVVFGRLICGMLCPFGLVQDLLHKIPAPKWKMPKKADQIMRYLKYAVLFVMVILLPAFAVTKIGIAPPYFCKYLCPAGSLGGGIPLLLENPALRQLAGALFNWKIAALLIILIFSIFINRPFCRYLCPLGAFYALFNRFSVYQMQVEESKCTNCKICERSCPMAVEVTKNINARECIRCGKCKAVCQAGAISCGFNVKK